jgi:hypothetical protein
MVHDDPAWGPRYDEHANTPTAIAIVRPGAIPDVQLQAQEPGRFIFLEPSDWSYDSMRWR